MNTDLLPASRAAHLEQHCAACSPSRDRGRMPPPLYLILTRILTGWLYVPVIVAL